MRYPNHRHIDVKQEDDRINIFDVGGDLLFAYHSSWTKFYGQELREWDCSFCREKKMCFQHTIEDECSSANSFAEVRTTIYICEDCLNTFTQVVSYCSNLTKKLKEAADKINVGDKFIFEGMEHEVTQKELLGVLLKKSKGSDKRAFFVDFYKLGLVEE